MINLIQKSDNSINMNTKMINSLQTLLSSNELKTYKLAKKCEDGVILHAWNWYFNDIKNNMREIAKSGYSSIQVSPIQPNKDGKFTCLYDWWKLYQPIDFSIGNTLGSEQEFKEMCDEAKKYGIKIIVDVVSNHLAGNSGNGNNAKWNRNNSIPSYLKDNDDFWHNESFGAFYNDNDRTSMTKGAIGMPGLNTSNKDLQQIIINFLNRAQELGADGFRFDAAKHIELPNDYLGSDYWPTIINGIKKVNPEAFVYGEILNSCATDIKNYSNYMKVTDNEYGWNVIDAVTNCNAGLAQNYVKNDIAKNFVTWVESHDTYAGDYGRKSDNVCELDIKLGWCIVASRADSVPLFFGRPSNGLHGNLGIGSSLWKDKTITEINKFHNKFAGENEYIRILNNNSVFEIERGDGGVVIVNLSHNFTKINTVTNLKDGNYKDKVTGNNITVKNHILTAELSGKSVIIAYNDINEVYDTNYIDLFANYLYRPGSIYVTNNNNLGNKIYAYVYSEKDPSKYIKPWPGIEMNFNDSEYYYDLPLEWQNEDTRIIFTDGHNQYPMSYNPGFSFVNGKAILFDNNEIKYIHTSSIVEEKSA